MNVVREDCAALKILLVEENPNNLLCELKTLVKSADWVENGIQALERLEIIDYDIIFMDCTIPVLDDYQTTQKLREIEAKSFRHTIVIAMTANALP